MPAKNALAQVAGERGVSREQAVRDLLAAHLAEQEARPEEERLSHISTVLQYPPAPPGREPDGRRRLGLRLDEGVVERCRQLGLRLPGQSPHRALRDYGSRPLTDAVVTAISRVQPFLDDGLHDLPVHLRHREAWGLWRLTVAATLTPAELQELLVHPDDDPVNVVLREEDVAWHHPWRFQVALHLTRRLLTGGDAETNRRMLWDQTGAFRLLQSDFENHTDFDHRFLTGLRWPDAALSGRGGAVVWRAKRKVALDGLAQWMATPGSRPVTVDPPGWDLTMPAGWRAHVFRADLPLPTRVRDDLDHGHVVTIPAGSSTVAWPYTVTGSLVAGFAEIAAGAGRLQPVQLAELAMVTTEDLGRHPRMSAETAHHLGFITESERAELTAEAADRTSAEIARVLTAATRRDQTVRAELQSAVGDPPLFARLARRAGLSCFLSHPTWTWHMHSIPDTLAGGADPAQLRWLGQGLRQAYRLSLDGDMRMAGQRGYGLGQPQIRTV